MDETTKLLKEIKELKERITIMVKKDKVLREQLKDIKKSQKSINDVMYHSVMKKVKPKDYLEGGKHYGR